ncbi:MAG: methyl-accepting chemotaxis protein [Pseudomonadota bacterium]
MSIEMDPKIQALVREGKIAARRTLLHLLVLLVPPALLSIGLATYIVTVDLKVFDQAKAEADAVALGQMAVSVATELQKERGMSAGFMGSAGAQFGPELATQREATDAALADAWMALRNAQLAALPNSARDVVAARIDRVATNLEALEDRRTSVSALEAVPGETLAYYTDTVRTLLSLADLSGLQLERASKSILAENYFELVMAGEYGGLERAAGSAGFGGGAFPPALLNRFISLQARQESLLQRYLETAKKADLALLQAALDSPAGVRIAELREIAVSGAASGDLQGITGPEWFAAATDFLGELAGVRAVLSDKLVLESQENIAAARVLLFEVLGAVVLMLAASAALAFWQANRFILPLNKLAKGLQRLARGLSDVWINGAERADIVGLLARAMTKIAKQGAENTRIRSALSASTAQIMILDEAGNLLFVNPALEKSADESLEFFMEQMSEFDPSESLRHMATLAFSALSDLGEDINAIDREHLIEVHFDNRVFDVTLAPVLDADRVRIGTSTEWREVTATRQIEMQLTGMMEAVKEGTFTRRLAITTSQKFLKDISEGMNEICGAVDEMLTELKFTLQALAEGDLTQQVDGAYRGDLRDLADATNVTIESLRTLVGEVVANTHEIRRRGSDITTTSDGLARSTETAAASLEEAAAAMEQLSTSVRSTASHAQEVKSISDKARDGVEHGGNVLTQTVDAMNAIKASSERITEIVSVIDGISFQTNLLALNAAVEAARAGEAGKGFAVVASEVRALAQRSAEAANDIKSLVEESAVNVTTGVDLVGQTRSALTDINALVGDMNGRMDEITSANAEQSTGVSEISQTISELDKLVQDTATAAQQNASNANLLAADAMQLETQVGRFKTTGADASRPAA